ncbi:LysR family transcriptional regulator [Shimia ponticola]|uniref:LysR family transcriptional regulator n=1 Tax=Shimia ponticola TaxID=2582893 RepID=UPI0011BE3B0D|nr:LysR family transcriptional regulator [Shimia ponticola]
MRLEWLEDILAVVETGSFSEAAERRFLTQSAFSRRIRMIEDHVGVELFDRSRKPVQLNAATAAQERRIRDLTADLKILVNDLRAQSATAERRITLVAQHAIATSLAPRVIEDLVESEGLNVRLRSANLDDCYAMLMTHGAEFALTFRTSKDRMPGKPDFFQTTDLGTDKLIPVASPAMPDGPLGLIAYPKDVYLGQLCERDLLPGLTVERKAETALTTAALELARAGVGFAWVPQSLAQRALERREIVQLPDLPVLRMKLTANRLNEMPSPAERAAWDRLKETSY